MFREMRRRKQALPQDVVDEVLSHRTAGVVAVLGDDDYAYAVPISFVYSDGHIYFHSAKTGHKIEALKAHPKVSVCVIDQDEIHPEKVTTWYRSVIAFGTASMMEEPDKMRAARLLTDKFAKDYPEAVEEDIRHNYKNMEMVDITVEHVTGKESSALMKQRAEGIL